MSGDTFFRDIKNLVEKSKIEGSGDTFIDDLRELKMGLTREDLAVCDKLIDIVESLYKNKGEIIELIRLLIIIVDRINDSGQLKKQEARIMFSYIVDLSGVSQRDRKIYMSIFDNAVELAFWGRDNLFTKDKSKIKRFFSFFMCR